MATQPPPLPSADVASALGVYVTEEDNLRISSANLSVAVTIQVAGRIYSSAAGVMRPFAFSQAMSLSGAVTSTDYPLEEGWIQNVAVAPVSGAPVNANSFVRVEVVRGKGPGAVILAVLLQGPLTSNARLAYPGSPLQPPGLGPWRPRTFAGANPPPGAEILESLPSQRRFRIQSVTFSFTTDATVIDREVSLTIDDGTTVVGVFPSGVVQPASLTRQYTAGAQGIRGASAIGGDILIAIPPLAMVSLQRIGTRTTNRQAGDDFSAPNIFAEECLDV